jgi:putative ABC transport system permease protein
LILWSPCDTSDFGEYRATNTGGKTLALERLVHILRSRWRSLFHRQQIDQELDDEINSHLDLAIDENIAKGMTPQEARRAARIELGGVEQVREEVRVLRAGAWLDTLFQDARFGVRMLQKSPGFSLVAVLTLALGIGSTTIMFSAIYGALIAPVPYKNSNQLAYVYIHDASQPTIDGRRSFSVPEFMDYREQNTVFVDMMGVSYPLDVLDTSGQGTELFEGSFVTPNSFEFLGVNPFLGRGITSEDGKQNSSSVFAMSYRLWSKDFNRNPGVLGTTMILNGVPRTLVGIMPPRFLLADSDIWIPVRWSHTDISNSETFNVPLRLQAMGRLKRGVSLEAAAADFDVIARRLAAVYPKNYPKEFTVLTKTLVQGGPKPVEGILYTLMAAVLLLLLIACSNIANLLLARATTREREMAVRASLGASGGRLIRQLLVEGLILAVGGCVVGCIFAYIGLREFVAAIPPHTFLPEVVIAMNPVVLLFAVCVALFTTLLSGLAPATYAVRGALCPRMTGSGKGSSAGLRQSKLRASLVIAEVALSVLLLLSAGLMMRTMVALNHVDLGFNPANILSANLAFPKGDTAQQRRLFFGEVLRRVTALPGVVAATITLGLPFYGAPKTELTLAGRAHSGRRDAFVDLCSDGYFQTLGLPLMRGRLLSETDIYSMRRVTVVNQTLARDYFGNEDPIGQKIRFNVFDRLPNTDTPHDAYFEIIGIVQDARNQGLRNLPMPEAFVPYTISREGNRGILVRTTSDPILMLRSVRQAIWAVDPDATLSETDSMTNLVKEHFSYAGPEFEFVSLGTFAGIGLALVIIGVFSVMDYIVSLQTHEIGIRMALGAQRGNILRAVIGKGLMLVATGTVIGLCASFGLTRFLASQIFGITATDPWTFGGVVASIVVVGLAACYVPALRAMRVDPMVALRYE